MVESCNACPVESRLHIFGTVLNEFRDSVVLDTLDIDTRTKDYTAAAEIIKELEPAEVAYVDQSIAFITEANALQLGFNNDILGLINEGFTEVGNIHCPTNPGICPRANRIAELLHEVLAKTEAFNDNK